MIGIRDDIAIRLMDGREYTTKMDGRVDSFKAELWALWRAVQWMDEEMMKNTISIDPQPNWKPMIETYTTAKRDWYDDEYDDENRRKMRLRRLREERKERRRSDRENEDNDEDDQRERDL